MVRLVVNDYLPAQGFDFAQETEPLFVDVAGVYSHNNFDELKKDAQPYEVLRMLYHSLRNLRKVPNFDVTNRALSRNSDLMKRTSCLAELELHYIYAL